MTFSTKPVLLFSAVLLAQLFNGCQKQKSSGFKLNKHEYIAGDYLDYTNLSSKTNKQVWTVTNKAAKILYTKNEANPDFRLGLMLPDGTYFLNLYENEKKAEKNIGCTRQFELLTLRGGLVISTNNLITYKVFIDGDFIGYYKGDYFKLNVPVGLHLVTLTNAKLDIKSETHQAHIDETFDEYLEFE